MKAHVKALSLALVASVALPALRPSSAWAQGCEPIRFTTPVNLGGQGEAYQAASAWQFTLAYRRLVSNEFFVGTQENPSLGPGGQSPVFKIHTFVADVAYAFNDRFRMHLSVPVSNGYTSHFFPDKSIHTQSVTGLGDVSLLGEAWMLTPRTHPHGNVEFGLGLKAPTGSHTAASQYYAASGPVNYPADQQIQPGDGGWGVLLQSQAFRQLTDRTYGYAFGSYMISPKAQSDVALAPNSLQYWSVPDVYSARLGGAFAVLPDQGLTLSLGGRVDGIPVHDLMGGGDKTTVKRSAYVLFADPGLSLSRGSGTFTLSVPYRLKVNRQKSVLEQRTNAQNGGGFAKYLVFASYSYRM